MSRDQTWVEALKISPESLSNWSMQAPPGTPLLVWCMTNGHVDAEKYLEWARDHFGLAVLDSRFFTDSFNPENLVGLRNQSPWSAWCFPVGEWDGTTFVACTEPPSELPEGKYALFLADPQAMQEAWGDDVKITTEIIDAPVGINPAAKSTFVLNLGDDVMGSHAQDHDHTSEHQTSATTVGVPDNTVATVIGIVNLENTMANRAIEPTATPPSQAQHHFDEKTGITLSIIQERAQTAPPPPPQPAAKAKSAPPPPAPPPKASPAPRPAAVDTNVDIKGNFESLREMYQSVLVMRCGEGVAEPFQWDSHLPITAGDSKFKVNLSYPGFLRIVAKTLQPYHGYVIDSPSHREFFENLNIQELPTCVSAIPLKAGEKLWGILVAFGGEAAKSQESLNEALVVADKIAATLGLSRASAA